MIKYTIKKYDSLIDSFFYLFPSVWKKDRKKKLNREKNERKEKFFFFLFTC